MRETYGNKWVRWAFWSILYVLWVVWLGNYWWLFGLIPIFSISACDATRSATMQSWCLAALTDRVVADVAAFLNAER